MLATIARKLDVILFLILQYCLVYYLSVTLINSYIAQDYMLCIFYACLIAMAANLLIFGLLFFITKKKIFEDCIYATLVLYICYLILFWMSILCGYIYFKINNNNNNNNTRYYFYDRFGIGSCIFATLCFLSFITYKICKKYICKQNELDNINDAYAPV